MIFSTPCELQQYQPVSRMLTQKRLRTF